MPLRIALLTPAPLDSPRGNAVTVGRIARDGAALVAYHHPAAP
jgi:hypothetical protein